MLSSKKTLAVLGLGRSGKLHSHSAPWSLPAGFLELVNFPKNGTFWGAQTPPWPNLSCPSYEPYHSVSNYLEFIFPMHSRCTFFGWKKWDYSLFGWTKWRDSEKKHIMTLTYHDSSMTSPQRKTTASSTLSFSRRFPSWLVTRATLIGTIACTWHPNKKVLAWEPSICREMHRKLYFRSFTARLYIRSFT